MNAFVTSLAVTVFVFAGAMVGMHLHRVLPERHLSKETQDVIRLGTGMLSVLASLVLGLLIATVKTSYDATDTAVRSYCTDLIVLDETLRDYGDGALGPRRQLRNYTMRLMHDLWPVEGNKPMLVEDSESGVIMEHVWESIRALAPADAGQRWLMDQALQMTTSLLRQRWLMAERSELSVRPVVIVILVSWIVAIFASFGLSAPRNATVLVAFAICALAIGSSIFIVLELDSPFHGVLQISNRPIHTAFTHMVPLDK
jgi:uncharacterized protein (DUF486 family)